MRKRHERKVHHCICQGCHLHPYSQEAKQHQAINRVLSELNERNKRRFAGVLANEEGRGGITHLAEITGFSRTTIARGCREIERSNRNLSSKIRHPGAGRPLVEKNNRRS
jgi:response regulator of citrate/malate metabolism